MYRILAMFCLSVSGFAQGQPEPRAMIITETKQIFCFRFDTKAEDPIKVKGYKKPLEVRSVPKPDAETNIPGRLAPWPYGMYRLVTKRHEETWNGHKAIESYRFKLQSIDDKLRFVEVVGSDQLKQALRSVVLSLHEAKRLYTFLPSGSVVDICSTKPIP